MVRTVAVVRRPRPAPPADGAARSVPPRDGGAPSVPPPDGGAPSVPPPDGGVPRVGPEVRRLARATVRTLREDGLIAVAHNVLALAGARRLTVFHRSTSVLRGGTLPPGIALREVTRHGLAAYAELRPDAPLPEMRRRLDAGHVCMGAWREDRLLSVRWQAHRRAELHYLGVSFALAAGVVYAYDAFTGADARRSGLSALVSDELVRIAAAEGATSVLNAVLPENREGMGLAHRDVPIGVLRTFRVGPRLMVTSTVPPGFIGDPRAL